MTLDKPARRRRLGAVAAALVAGPFALLTVGVLDGWAWLERIDTATTRLQGVTAARPWLAETLRVVSDVTDPDVLRLVGVVLAAVLWRRGLRRATAWFAVTMAVGGALSGLLKLAVARPRPAFDDPVAVASGYSFPSGHALNSMLFAVCLLVLFHRRTRGGARRALWVGAVVLVLVTGYDRLGLGVHYPSDVVAGWVVALATVAACLAAFGVERVAQTPATGPRSTDST